MDWQEKFLDNLTTILYKEQPRWPKGHPKGGQWKDSGSSIPTADDLSKMHEHGKEVSGVLFGDQQLYMTNAPQEVVESFKEGVETKLRKRLEGNEDYAYFKENFLFRDMNNSPYSVERVLVGQWAASSGNDQPLSIYMQRMAKKEFGLDDADLGHLGSRGSARLDEMLKAAKSKKYPVDTDRMERGARAFLREMYNETQHKLESAGIKEVILYRGWGDTALKNSKDMKKTSFDSHDSIFDHTLDFYEGEVKTQPMSSFSYRAASTQDFSYVSKSFGKKAVTTVTKVPASKILATPASGYGCLNEHEMVVLGSKIKSVSVAVDPVVQGMAANVKVKYIQQYISGELKNKPISIKKKQKSKIQI